MNINLKEDVKPISYIKTNAAEMIDYINDYKNPIIITQHGEAKGVFLDIESYQDMINALSLMKLLQFSEKSIREGKVYDNDQVFSELRKKLVKRMDKKYFVKWTAPAREDVNEIIDYISKTNINYAVKILDNIEENVKNLEYCEITHFILTNNEVFIFFPFI